MGALEFIMARGEAWVQYAAASQMLRLEDGQLHGLRRRMMADDRIQGLLDAVADFHSRPVSAHKDPSHAMHRLLFLLDLGIGQEEPRIVQALEAILLHRDRYGAFQTRMKVEAPFADGEGLGFAWALCDAPLLMLALAEAGGDFRGQIRPGLNHLMSLQQDGAFPCAVSAEIDHFRGPGRKADPCPFATLAMLRLLCAVPDLAEAGLAESCARTLLSLFENSLTQHPYQFFMGTDFRKLKAPTVWYDLLSVTDALSHIAAVHEDPRFLTMVDLIRSKADAEGCWTPESVYLKCAAWDFGQKRQPSPYLSFLCLRLLSRLAPPAAAVQ
ncbi:MAG: hypothetical protein AB9880_06525 [Christensenellales bacterium]